MVAERIAEGEQDGALAVGWLRGRYAEAAALVVGEQTTFCRAWESVVADRVARGEGETHELWQETRHALDRQIQAQRGPG